MGTQLFKTILVALVDSVSKNLDQSHSGTNRSCSADAQGSNGEKYTGDLEWQNSTWNWPWDENQEIS